MDIGVISVRYARALIKAALGMKLEDQVYQEMQTLFKSYIDVPELRFTIDNPMLSKDKKEALLITALGKEPTELSKKFIALVLKEDRESTLQFMAASYITLYRKQKNIIRGKLITATAVDASTEDIFLPFGTTLVRQPHYAGGRCADGDHLQDARSQGCEDDAAVCESNPKEAV